ncbi:hypothetical protein BCR43DRAFT_483759 [Syncephalastrum racemosum]|uniref:K Homology domain-containing protein n=1 Tax=Syncephalastrum racemosum TaxID=13706 RepID=A0A1X2HVS5_SYNRA|nr:hypothetical protein BCR43DRAFT_483759 [Syncephalastrum racemosum]
MSDTTQKKRKWDDPPSIRKETSPSPPKTTKTGNDDEKTSAEDAGKKAAEEALARVKSLLAQKGIQDDGSNKTSTNGTAASGGNGAAPATREHGDGEFVKDIPINDLKNRYMLTRGATQSQIQRDTGADVTTRGKYYPDKSLATASEPPLYLHISASNKEQLDKAVEQIEDMIKNVAPPAPTPAHHHHERRERRFYEHKVYVGLESSPHFNLRAKIVGPQGAYVKHIQQETGTRVQLKGKGSGFYESSTGVESDEALHVHISSPREDGMETAIKLTEDLIDTVKAEYERFKQNPTYGRGYQRGYQDYGYNYGGYGAPPPPSSAASSPPPPGASPAGSSGSPAAASAPPGPGSDPNYDAYQQYYAYYGQYQYDPNYYNYYYGSGAAQQQSSPPPQSSSADPSPPPAKRHKEDDGQSYNGQSYNAVPPPPQL